MITTCSKKIGQTGWDYKGLSSLLFQMARTSKVHAVRMPREESRYSFRSRGKVGKSKMIQLGVCHRTRTLGVYQTDSPSSGFTAINHKSVVKSPEKFRKKVNTRHLHASESNELEILISQSSCFPALNSPYSNIPY